MQLYRIAALIKRYVIVIPRDFHRLIDLVYWPLLEIIIAGLLGKWLQSAQPGSQSNFMIVACLVIWQITLRVDIEVAFSFLDELWSHNFINLCSSPLHLSDWIVAVMFLGILRLLFIFVYSCIAVYLLFGFNLLVFGWNLIPILFLCLLIGWMIGFFSIGLIVYWGQKIQVMVWMLGWLFAPLSGVFTPLEILPTWLQTASYCLPTTYIFEGIRTLIATGSFPINNYLISFVLSIIYLTATLFFFVVMFKKSVNFGLARLERFE